MNIHAPEELKIKYPQYEFRGKQREINNRIVIEAYNPNTMLLTYPPKRGVQCNKCNHKDYVY